MNSVKVAIYEKFRSFVNKREEDVKKDNDGDVDMNDIIVSDLSNYAIFLQSGHK